MGLAAKLRFLAFCLASWASPALALTAFTDSVDANADTCVFALDARPEVEIPTVEPGHFCRYDLPTLPVGAHTIKAKVRSKAHPELWEDSAYTSPKDFAVRGVLAAPGEIRLQ